MAMSDDAVNNLGWTFSDIAAQTGMSVSGVANWRNRYRDSFPKPIGRSGVALVFDPIEVRKWLANNPQLTESFQTIDKSSTEGEEQLTRAFWNSVNLIRGMEYSFNYFSLFTDALAHSFELQFKDSNSSPWMNFVSDHAKEASKLREDWIAVTSRTSIDKSKFVLQWLDLLSQQVGGTDPTVQFMTPPAIAETLAKIVAPESGQFVVDPCVGLGTLLLQTALEGDGTLKVYGREINKSVAQAARAIFSLSAVNALIEEGDSVRGEPLPAADRVVAAPPLNHRLNLTSAERKDFRWDYADPGSEGGDLVWAQLVLSTMNESGIGAMLTSRGILFKGGRTESFRQRLIGRGHLEAAITLPSGFLAGTSLPCTVLVFNKAQSSNALNAGVLMVDVSISKTLGKSRRHFNTPDELPGAIASLVLAHRKGLKIQTGQSKDFRLRYTTVRSGVLAENQFNLLPSRYLKTDVDTQDIENIKGKIAQVERRIDELNRQLASRRRPSNERPTQ
jgi:predicted DNA-binding transcriptional regulator AlpA